MRQAGARRSQETARAWERLAPAWRETEIQTLNGDAVYARSY